MLSSTFSDFSVTITGSNPRESTGSATLSVVLTVGLEEIPLAFSGFGLSAESCVIMFHESSSIAL